MLSLYITVSLELRKCFCITLGQIIIFLSSSRKHALSLLTSVPVSIFRATFDPPVKHHLNGVLLVDW